MSNGSRLRRDRARSAASAPHTKAPHAGAQHQHHATTRPASIIPQSVRVLAPHCRCAVPMNLLACRCCGSMEWCCSRQPIPPTHTRVNVLPPLPTEDTTADATASTATAAGPATV